VQENFLDANVYPEATPATRFAVTGWSMDPKSGLDRPGLERVLATVGGPARSLPPFGDPAKPPAGYRLDLAQWRALMHGDQNSAEAKVNCTVDRATWTVTLEVPESARRVRLPVAPEVARDFHGRPISGSVWAGPFANLGPGPHREILRLPGVAP
jgi:hypothetical protein